MQLKEGMFKVTGIIKINKIVQKMVCHVHQILSNVVVLTKSNDQFYLVLKAFSLFFG